MEDPSKNLFPLLKAFLQDENCDSALSKELLPLIENVLQNFNIKIDNNKERSNVRWQDDRIIQIIPEGKKVLDLGCGEGKLLQRLIKENKVFGQGVELNKENVYQCIDRLVPVFQADIDQGLSIFQDQSFDYVIMEETLQTLKDPLITLNEILRIGKRGIVTFPNFGFWKVRMDLFVRGKMPVTDWLPYRWYDTPNIHLFTYQDFIEIIDKFNYTIEEGFAYIGGEIHSLDERTNVDAEELLLVLKMK